MKSVMRGLVLIMTLNCEQSARLTSESFERSLTWCERCAVRIHNAICKKSRNLAAQLRILHAMCSRNNEALIELIETRNRLSPLARQRIEKSIQEHLDRQ